MENYVKCGKCLKALSEWKHPKPAPPFRPRIRSRISIVLDRVSEIDGGRHRGPTAYNWFCPQPSCHSELSAKTGRHGKTKKTRVKTGPQVLRLTVDSTLLSTNAVANAVRASPACPDPVRTSPVSRSLSLSPTATGTR